MFLTDVKDILQNAGVGTEGVSIFWSSAAELPDQHDAIFLKMRTYGGEEPTIMHATDADGSGEQKEGVGYEHPRVQIIGVGPTWEEAEAMAFKAYWAIMRDPAKQNRPRRNFTINDTYYVLITAEQTPNDLGKLDDIGRAQAVFNVRATKRPDFPA